MKQPCPTDRQYPNDPQDEQIPDYTRCPHCNQPIAVDNLCEVPIQDSYPNSYRYCCPDCYDEVCEEEGYTPEGASK